MLLLMPFYRLGTVSTIVDRGPGYPACAFTSAVQVRRMFQDAAEGLEFMHRACGVRHNDVKVANFLLTDDMRVVITDFGSVGPEKTRVQSRREALLVQEEVRDHILTKTCTLRYRRIL